MRTERTATRARSSVVEHHIDIVRAASSILAVRTKAMEQTITVTKDNAGQRLDVFCVQRLSSYSRAAIQKAIKEGRIQVGGKAVKPRYVVQPDDVITAAMPAVAVPPTSVPTTIKIPIIHEDRDIIVINKPAGIVVHPGQGQEQQSVVDRKSTV